MHFNVFRLIRRSLPARSIPMSEQWTMHSTRVEMRWSLGLSRWVGWTWMRWGTVSNFNNWLNNLILINIILKSIDIKINFHLIIIKLWLWSPFEFTRCIWCSWTARCNDTLEFTCSHDYVCIPWRERCDGKNDCEDGSDEHSCCEIYNIHKIIQYTIYTKYNIQNMFDKFSDQWFVSSIWLISIHWWIYFGLIRFEFFVEVESF